MRKIPVILVVLLLMLLAASPSAGRGKDGKTLKNVVKRGVLICGVNENLPGFGFVDESGRFSGFDVDFCRALAAAVFGDAGAVEYVPTTGSSRFPILQSGEIDVLIRNATRTLSRDAGLELHFGPTTFYDGIGLMTRGDSGINELVDLEDKSVCVVSGSASEYALKVVFAELGINVKPYNDLFDALIAYDNGDCDAFSFVDKSYLANLRTLMPTPDEHKILDETITKEPLGPVVRHGDDNWQDIVDWTVFCTIAAEEYGVSRENVDVMLGSDDIRIEILLGVGGPYGETLGLSNDFCYQIIKQVGNYGEIYDDHLGPATELYLPRALNRPYTDGGLLYAPPFH